MHFVHNTIIIVHEFVGAVDQHKHETLRLGLLEVCPGCAGGSAYRQYVCSAIKCGARQMLCHLFSDTGLFVAAAWAAHIVH